MASLNIYAWRLLGGLSLALGFLGIFLPLLPTTPFVLVAAFAFGRGSPRLAAWLRNHRQFGPLIDNWSRTGSISPPIKILACSMMALALAGSWLAGLSSAIVGIQAFVLSICAVFIISRPNQ